MEFELPDGNTLTLPDPERHVSRLQADIGILLVQSLHPLLHIGDPIRQVRRAGSEVVESGDIRR